MFKIVHVVAIGALVSSALYAYSIKYDTTLHAEQLTKLKAKAQREREAIAVLKAEWQHLNRPERLQPLADQHLPLQTLAVGQIVRMQDIPMRGPKVDSIGRKMEDLGLLTSSLGPASDKTGSEKPGSDKLAPRSALDRPSVDRPNADKAGGRP